MRGAEQVVGALSIVQTEDAVAVRRPAVAGLVGLARQQRGERQLLAADRFHLVADDRLDLAQHAEAERQPGVDAWGRAPDVARAEEQPVARHLGVRGVLPQGPHEQARHPEDPSGASVPVQAIHGRKATARPGRSAKELPRSGPGPVCGPSRRAPGSMARHRFAFSTAYRIAGLPFGVTPRTAWAEVDKGVLRIRFGLWRLHTEVSNVAGVDASGGYAFLKTAGPAHLSLSDAASRSRRTPNAGCACASPTHPGSTSPWATCAARQPP